MKKRSFDKAPGDTTEKKFEKLGINVGETTDFRDLLQLNGRYMVDIVLYFETELAQNSRYEDDLIAFDGISEFERPFILLPTFMEFVKESDPEFVPRLSMFPMELEIAFTGEHTAQGMPRPLVKALLPFSDELGEWSEEETAQ